MSNKHAWLLHRGLIRMPRHDGHRTRYVLPYEYFADDGSCTWLAQLCGRVSQGCLPACRCLVVVDDVVGPAMAKARTPAFPLMLPPHF